MEVVVHPRPNLLMETADLVCAYFNQISPEKLTSVNPGCIPASVVAEMMEQVCCNMDQTDIGVEFFFRGFLMDVPSAEGKQTTCLGSILVRNELRARNCELGECRAILHSSILGNGKPCKINDVTAYGIDTEICAGHRPVSQELRKLALPEELRLRLTEVLSSYHYHVDWLCDLLEPLALRLEPLLAPWVEKIQPRVEQWRGVLETEKGLEDFLSRFNRNLDWPERIYVGLHLFYPAISVAMSDRESRTFYCCAGLEMPPLRQGRQILAQMEIAALRLLSSADRIEMLRAMSGRVMTQKEITRELGINPGTVFRDLNSLNMTQLVNLVLDGSYRGYTTNLDYLEKIATSLVQYIRNGN